MTTANPERTRIRRVELPGLPGRLRMRRRLAHVVATESPVRPRSWFASLRAALDRPLTSYYLLLGASALLLTIGLIMVLSASSVYSYEHYDGDSYAVVRKQLVWVLIGLPLGAATTVVLVLAGRLSAPAVLLPVLTAVIAGVACDVLLSARAKARVGRLTEELPTVLEFLALCLSAGEGLPDALHRVGHAGSGELSGELRGVTLAVNTGSSLADALGDCAHRLQIPPLTRAVDQIIAALERGAPLAAVLQAQASDAREETKRSLIEQAGRKEILMLLPLVFLILPLSVLFAVFPGVFILRLGIG